MKRRKKEGRENEAGRETGIPERRAVTTKRKAKQNLSGKEDIKKKSRS